jgi:hypothetical protein
MNALAEFSSEQSGHFAAYATDNSSGTWWQPEPTDARPTLTIELSPATRFDRVQLFTIDSLRLMFNGGRRGFGGMRRGGTPPAETASPTSERPETSAYQYKIEVSMDGESYKTALDMTKKRHFANVIFEEIPPFKSVLSG